MNCPLCGTNINSNVRFCPVCGADIEAAQRRSQEATKPMPGRAQPPQQNNTYTYNQIRNSRGQIQAGLSNLDQPQFQGRTLDTNALKPAPKWPIVLIILLLAVIVAAVLLIIFHPWQPSTSTVGTAGTVANEATTGQTTETGVGQTAEVSAPIEEGTGETVQPAESTMTPENVAPVESTPAFLTNEEAFNQLNDAYNSLGGYNDRIVGVAAHFNNEDILHLDLASRQAALAEAQGVQADIQARIDALNAMQLAPDSPYVGNLETMKTLYNDLLNRIRVLADALNVSVTQGAEDPSSVDGLTYDILVADNGPDGVNRFKAEYDALIGTAAPAPL